MILNMTGPGISGGKLTVTTPGAGITVTAAKDGKTKTKVSGADGTAVFKGLEGGDWVLTMTDGSQTAQKTVAVTTDYAVALTFFAATINVSYPEGSSCTATDGAITLIAPDTSGTWACVVPNAGTWTVTATDGTHTESRVAEVAETGQVVSVALAYGIFYDSGTLFVPYTHDSGGSVQQNADHILMTTPANYSDGGVCGIIFDTRDLSNYRKAELVYGDMQSGCTIGFRIIDTDPDNAIVKTNSTSTSGTLALDLTSVTGMYSVYVLLFHQNYARTAKVMRVVLS